MDTSDIKRLKFFKARAALSNPDGRFESITRSACDDGWSNQYEHAETGDTGSVESLKRVLIEDKSRTVITYNTSPDVPHDRSINPYRGCEHGCIYCFARPTHGYLGLSSGLDFETQLFYKPEAATLLRQELGKASYHCAPVALGVNTDAYQPVERELKITRQILQVLSDFHHPVIVITKSVLVERDLDILEQMAQRKLVQVVISLTSLDRELVQRMEPRACPPQRRLEIIRRLSAANIPVGTLIAPVIPVLTDHELETLLQQAYNAGARSAGYVLLRMPHEIKELFYEWLNQYYPLKANHIMTRLRDCHDGEEYRAVFGQRMRGTGAYAQLIAQRFRSACRRNGFTESTNLDCAQFRQAPPSGQLTLF